VINLVDVSWLIDRTEDPQTTIIDPRPRVKYLQGHVPKAVNVPLSEVYDKETLGILPEEKLAQIFGKAGVDTNSAVTLYDSFDGQSASMLAWLLEYMGLPKVTILSDYFEGWVKQGGQIFYRPVSSEPKSFVSKSGRPTRALLSDVLHRRDSKLLDLRSDDEFRGKASTESRSGHIPGAVSLPWTDLIGQDLQFLKPKRELKERITAIGMNPSDRVVTYCSNGPRAAIGYVALQQLGFENVQVYDGSFHEWARIPDLRLDQASADLGPSAKPVMPTASPCVVNLPGMAPAE
jgi:thiosulfate/3-mercaptopyruvate sulfurtransferase